ncbi:hypothetical protein QOT17_021266 [Balamuthia mandrillaris]
MLEHLLVISHEGDIVLSEQFVMTSAATVPVATKEVERYEWEHNIYMLSREMWSYVIESKEREVIVTGDKNILFTAEGDFLVFVTGSGDYDCLALDEIMDSLLELFQLICRTASKRLCCETLVHEYMRLKMALDFMFSAKGEVEFLVAEQSLATTSLEMKELLAYAKKRKLTSMKSPRSGGSSRSSSTTSSPAPSSSSSSVAASSTTRPTSVPGMLSVAPPAPHIMNLRSPRGEGGSTSPISTSATLLVSPTTSMEMLGSQSPRMAVSSKEVPSRGGTLRSKSQRKSVSFEVYPLNLETMMMDPSMQELHDTTPGERTTAATEMPPLTSSNKEIKTSKSNNKGIARTSEWVASSSDGSHHHYSSSEEGAQEEGKKQEIGRQRKDSAKHAEEEALAALVNAEVERSVKEGDQTQQQATNIGYNIDDTPFLEEEEEQEEKDKKETGIGVDSGDSQQLLVEDREDHEEGAEPKQEPEQRVELVVEERQQLFLKVERKSQKFDGKKLAALTNDDSLIFRSKYADEELSSSTKITRSRSTTPSALQQDDEDTRGRRGSKSKESESSRHKLKDDDRSSSQSRERRDSKREHRDKDIDRERGGTYRDSKHRKGSRAHDKDLESITKAHNKRDRGDGQEQKERSTSTEPEKEKDRATAKEKDGRGDKDRAEGRERKPSRHGTLRETNPKTDQGASRRHSRGMEGELQQQP